MEIIKFPNYSLFTVCSEVTVFGPELKVMLDSMWETMKNERGLGLAANQVGLMWRTFTMEGPKQEQLYIVNPTITRRSISPANIKEGCLSAPGEFLVLSERAAWVELHGQNENGEAKRWLFEGAHAVCVQHEIDHLDGKSYMQSKTIPKKQRMELAKKWGFKVK